MVSTRVALLSLRLCLAIGESRPRMSRTWSVALLGGRRSGLFISHSVDGLNAGCLWGMPPDDAEVYYERRQKNSRKISRDYCGFGAYGGERAVLG